MAQDVLRVLNTLKEAYQERDRAVILENTDPALVGEILEASSFKKAELSFTPRMIQIGTSDIIIHLNWHGEWTINGNILKNRGVGTLVFQKETMRLKRIEGDNPFLVPSSNDLGLR
jgi:hypothetical protein